MNPSAALTAYLTIVTKEAKRILRLWIQTLFPPVITTILYFIIFGHVIGDRIGPMHGVSYIQFIAPGLIMMPMVINSFASGSASFFSAKMMHQIEELLVSPMSEFVMLAGYMTGGIVRGLMVGLIVGIVTVLFTRLPMHNIFIISTTAVLSCAFFSLFGVLNGVFANSFDDIALIPNFIITPLIYLGGVFYSIDMLAPFWRHLSLINPLFYIVDGFRDGFLNVSHAHTMSALIILMLMVAALFSFVWYLMKKGFRLRQ